jgi:hypothetical protein
MSKPSKRPVLRTSALLSLFLGVTGVIAAPPEMSNITEPAAIECDPGTAGVTTGAFAEGAAKLEAVRVSATGYGAPPPRYYPENQRRLMAMRASKIDAYRALAETINGLHIWGGTTIGDMVVQKDRYRVFLDGYVRGARIVSVTGNDDGNYETIVDVLVDDRFLRQILPQATSVPCPNPREQITFVPAGAPINFYYSE